MKYADTWETSAWRANGSKAENTRQAPAASPAPVRLPFWVMALALVLLSMLLLAGGLAGGEVSDDHDLLHSPATRGCDTNPAACFLHPQFGLYYRPLMAASFALGVAAHGTRPLLFHIENLILHAADVALVFWLFRLWFRREAPALLAGLLFALHPLHVGATAFIGGRTDGLALFFAAWFAIGLLRARQAEESADASRRMRWGWLIVSLLGFTGAVFSKEQCLPLVLLVPLFWQYAIARTSGPLLLKERREEKPCSPLIPVPSPSKGEGRREANIIPACVGRQRAAGPTAAGFSLPDGGLGPPSQGQIRGSRWEAWMLLYGVPVLLYLAAARRLVPASAFAPVPWSAALHTEMVGRTIWYYAKVLGFPTVGALHLSTLGPWETPQRTVALLGALCGGLWLALLWRLWPNRTLRALALWTMLTLLPCLNLIQVPSQPIASYRALLPLLGLAGLAGYGFAAAWPFWRLPDCARPPGAHPSLRITRGGRPQTSAGKREVMATLAGCLLLGFTWVTLADVPNWRSDLTLMRVEFTADPNFLPALAGLANALHENGQNAEALAAYDRALEWLLPGTRTEAERAALGRSPATQRRLQSASGPHWNLAEFITVMARGRGGVRQAL